MGSLQLLGYVGGEDNRGIKENRMEANDRQHNKCCTMKTGGINERLIKTYSGYSTDDYDFNVSCSHD